MAESSPLLNRRALSSFGGYALLTKPCPSGSSACVDTNSCCPEGWTCGGTKYGSVHCCPPEKPECEKTVASLPVCADPSWGLWKYASWPFCCPADSIGTFSPAGQALCLEKNLPIPSSIIVSTLTQATGTRTVAQGTGTRATNAAGQTTGAGSSGSTGSAGSSGSSDASSGSSSSNSSGKLPQGAMIAIAVLATIVAMFILFFAWYCHRKFKKSPSRRNNTFVSPAMTHAAPNMPPAAPQYDYVPPTTDSMPSATSTPPIYKSPSPAYNELAGNNQHIRPMYEADADLRVELDGSRRH